MDQIGSNQIKVDLMRLIGPNWIKLDQTRSNKNKFVQIRSNWIKRDKIGSSRIKSYESDSNQLLFFIFSLNWISKNK